MAKLSFKNVRLGISLINEKPKLSGIKDRVSWNKRVFEYLNLLNNPVVTSVDESNPDYQYLQSVIKRELSNMNDPEIGVRMTDILNRNSENSAFISYVQQAIAVYRESLISMSKQFLWGRA